MKFTTLFLAFAAALMTGDCAHGQLLKNLFGGGSTQSEPAGVAPSVLGQASNLLGQQKFHLPSLPSLPSLLNQQGSTGNALGQGNVLGQGNALGQGNVGDLSKFIPTPQLPSLSPPSFLNQFNAKSKEMIDRTTEWARTKQQEMKEKSFGRLAKSNPLGFLNGDTPAVTDQQTNLVQPPTIPPQQPNYFAKPEAVVPAQPQIRSATNPNGQPAVRF